VKTLLICHHDAPLDHQVLAGWLASFSDLAGIVVLREPKARLRARVRREIRRVGVARFADVLAFQLFYRLALARRDARWEAATLRRLGREYPLPPGVPVLQTDSPNSPEAEAFIRQAQPTIVLARCKSLIKESVFSVPSCGTWVMHPGICPEYRNAHGCFWALASDDLENVGMTLLRIDRGVDTGPVFGYYRSTPDEVNESHVVLQHRVVLDHLDALREKLVEIAAGRAVPLQAEGRPSATWGQPWLSRYLRWKRQARRRAA
jgi:hypothetical protein